MRQTQSSRQSALFFDKGYLGMRATNEETNCYLCGENTVLLLLFGEKHIQDVRAEQNLYRPNWISPANPMRDLKNYIKTAKPCAKTYVQPANRRGTDSFLIYKMYECLKRSKELQNQKSNLAVCEDLSILIIYLFILLEILILII